MLYSSLWKNRKRLALAFSAAMMVPILSLSQSRPPDPTAELLPTSLTANVAHQDAPVDLTSTLTNTGGSPLTWRIGAIRDVSAESAPAVATGPIATARLYNKTQVQTLDYAPGEIIVGLKEEPAGTATGKVAAKPAPTGFLGGRAKVRRELIRARRVERKIPGARQAAPVQRPGRKLFLVDVADKSKAGMQKAIDELRKDPTVAYAEPNYQLKAIGIPDDPHFDLLYGMHNVGQNNGVVDADIDAPEAWDMATGDDNVLVGVIDTGIDYLHPDLVDNMWTNPGEIPGNGIDDEGNGYVDDVHGYDFANHDGDPMDDHYHGTHCAGTIAARGNNGIGVAGVAWKAKLVALKFLSAGGSGSTADAIEAIAYANAMNIPITSNSWGGGGFSQALKDVIDAGGQRGFLFVAAAGNNGSNADQIPMYPAAYESDNIISVAATDSRDGLAGFSNYGRVSVDLGAPGVSIYSCQPGNRYQYLSGTSMATPHVAGAATLLKSYNPQLGYIDIKAALMRSVDSIASLSGRVASEGRLNIQRALGMVNPPWVTLAPRGSGELTPGASQVLTATVNPAALTAGEHRALVQIVTNDPANPNRELEVVAHVAPCRNLSVTPEALDFGDLWEGASRALTLTLNNSCNDATRLDSALFSESVFSIANALPLTVPAFGKATLEVVYRPPAIQVDSGVVTLVSNAEDHSRIAIPLRGTGIAAPSIAVSPSSFELTLNPSEQAIRQFTVRNTGGDVLTLKLAFKEGSAAQAIGQALLIPGQAKSGAAYGDGLRKNLVAPKGKVAIRATGESLRVLYLTTLLATGRSDDLVRGLQGLSNVASVEVLNGQFNTPNLAYLQNFDMVVVSSNFGWADPVLLGNTLADYADQGGGLCLMVAALANSGPWGLLGRITTPEYMPIRMAGPGVGGQAVEFAAHPITAGMQSLSCILPIKSSQTQGEGIALGHYANSTLIGAVNPAKPVVAINVFPASGAWSGDLVLMVGNSLDYLSNASGWAKVQPRKASLAPGDTLNFTVTVSAEKQLAGDHLGSIAIEHNAPRGDNPLNISLLMHVRPVSLLALPVPKHDFGGLLVGNQSLTNITLINSGNQSTTVTTVDLPSPFHLNTALPLVIPAFSKAELALTFAPTLEGAVLGIATLHSNAADHPSLTLALRGQGLPAPIAMLTPESLSVNLAYNAAPADLTSILSNPGRGVLKYTVGGFKEVRSVATVNLSKAVQAARIYQAANYDREAIPGELIVGLRENTASIANITGLASVGIQVKRSVLRARSAKSAVLGQPKRKILLVTYADDSKAGMLRAIEDLRKDANVAYAEPNYRLKAIATPNDPDFGLLYGLHNEGQTGGSNDADIDAPEAWDNYTGEHNVIVGIIDTGIDYLHPDLVDNIWTNAGEIPGNSVDDDGNGYVDDVHGYDFANQDSDPYDDHFHGTHVAGTIAASGNNGLGIVGVAWKARLAALKFLDAGGSGSLDAAVEAIAYANAMGFPITSNSWGGGGFSQALKDVIDAGGEQGNLFVAAAGNDYSDNDQYPAYPASYESDNIISVAATNSTDGKADFSNYGAATVDLGAPGVEIYSCAPGQGYQYLSGTSMATPHVSGAAALLKSFNPQMEYAQIKAALLASVDTLSSLQGLVLSQGRLNVQKALANLSPPWVSLSPRGSGQVEPGASQALNVRVDPKGLVAGEHRGSFTLTTNDPKAPTKTLSIAATVSGCRNLSVTPTALDFGLVWTGSSKRLALSLVNTCNDFTQVNAVELSHKTFTRLFDLPVQVPPFGSIQLEILYTPDDLNQDKATITVKSNAQNQASIKVSAKGTGVKPPSISVNPTKVNLTMDPSEQRTSVIKVSNKGGAEMRVALSLSLDKKKADSGLAPKVLVLPRKVGSPYPTHASPSLKPKTIHPMVKASASGLKVLYLTTLYLPDSLDDGFMQGIRGLPQVAVLERLDGTVNVPNADFLSGYDVVLVSAGEGWADPVAIGDALAEYVDAGGKVCLLVAAIANGGPYELQGRIATPDYLPMVKAGPGYGGQVTTFTDHPITQGLSSIECFATTMASETQGNGISLGLYPYGELLGAVNPDKAVVAINVFPADGFWAGDLILMMSNTLDYLGSMSRWAKIEPAQLVIPPGKTVEAKVIFDTENLAADLYTGTLKLTHNAPGQVNPLTVPLSLTVKSKNCLETSVAVIDFGKVWTDRYAQATVTLKNPCNQPTQVNSLALLPKVFKTSVVKPLTVDAFSEVAVELTYTPDDLYPDLGGLVIKSNAKDNPLVLIALKGTGIRPPSISIKPSALNVALDPGVQVAKSLDIFNAGGDTLRLAVAVKSVADVAKGKAQPKILPGKASMARPLVGKKRPILPHASARDYRPQAGGSLKVLYLQAMGIPTEGDSFVQGLRDLANVDIVDLVDIREGTPNLEYLQAYDVALVSTDNPAADPKALGDVLADYVDAGGKIAIMGATFYSDSPLGLGGRIMDTAYLPIHRGYFTNGFNSKSLVDHPINEGIGYINSYTVIEADSTVGAGLPLGNYETGSLTGAYHAIKPIVALNFFPIDGFWGGDILLMMGNTLDYLANSIRWMKPKAKSLLVPPGKTVKLPVNFSTEEMVAGQYEGILRFTHNAPAITTPLNIPVTLQVKSKRCLAVEPATLDFDKTWKGGSDTLDLSLINRCNEPTRIESVRFDDGAYSSANAMPMLVEPFATTKIRLVFAPKDTKVHKGKAEIRSNAQDNSRLMVSLKGQGVLPPTIAVTPGEIKVSVNAGEVKTQSLTLSNKGGDTLVATLSSSVESKTVAPKAAMTSLAVAGYHVLYLTDMTTDSMGYDPFVEGLRSLPKVASLDVANINNVNRQVDFLLGYDQVVVATVNGIKDSKGLGDALADYVDLGGRICLMNGTLTNYEWLRIEGRISTPEYLPMVQAEGGFGGIVTSFVDHPINAGISYLVSWSPTVSTEVQGYGQPLGYLESGALLGAWNTQKAVVALNILPFFGAWNGDLIPMMGNIFDFLVTRNTWLKAAPKSLRIPPGGTAVATVTLDGSRIEAGAYIGAVTVDHNVPGKSAILLPVNFTVGGRLGIEVSTTSLDFGSTLLGDSASQSFSVLNTGNLPVTVSAQFTGNSAFALDASFPRRIEAGRWLTLNATYTPTLPGGASATLIFEAADLAPLTVSMTGLGIRPADLVVTTAPSPLLFDLHLDGQDSGEIVLANAGDEDLTYRLFFRPVVSDSLPPDTTGTDTLKVYGASHYAPLIKGALDTRVGAPVTTAFGGPDSYGYRWFDSQYEGGPAFKWVDISRSGQRLATVSNCDDCFESVRLSFAFPFYGRAFESVFVSSNGYVTFDTGSAAFSNHPLPSAVMPSSLVAALFQDLYPAAEGAIYFQDFGDRAVLQFQNVPDFLGTGRYDFEIILRADGIIDLQYLTLTGVKNTATVGIQNGLKADGLTVVYNADYLQDNLAIRLRTWLALPPTVGILAGQEQKRVKVSVDSRTMPPGNYHETLKVEGHGSKTFESVEIPVDMTINPAAAKK